MKKIIAIYSMVAVMIVASSCELDLQQDPNNLSPESASVDFVLNSAQFAFKDWLYEANEATMQMARITDSSPRADTYIGWTQPEDFDDVWELTYTSILSDIKTLIPLAEEKELNIHAGIGKVLRAYLLMNMVDAFGDIPYSEALDANNFEPVPDDGASVYAAAEADLVSAIADFQAGGLAPASDIFYGGNAASWEALANTLLLRKEITTRLVGGSSTTINNLIGKTISADQNFAFQHSANAQAPDSRQEFFLDNYVSGATDYQSSYFMWLLVGTNRPYSTDPRARYYFYRQADFHTDDVNEQNCVQETRPSHYPPDGPWCNDFLPEGYWGRDHQDTDGIPPDSQLRTLFGVYPAGGAFDDDSFSTGANSTNLGGAGIHPMMMSFWVDFMLAEGVLTMGVNGDAAEYLRNGIEGSISYVMDFGSSIADPDFIPSETQISNYVNEIMTDFASRDDAGKLDLIAEQYFISLYGNGFEPFNFYRRSGLPSNIQLPLVPQPGEFVRSFFYPASAVNTNNNFQQKTSLKDAKVFWDTNPAALN
ncbi:MAG: SusD/RagB family nutrient-binding outer membrane lipoprotein [Cyclobacteriaceae bacterium]